MAVTKAETGENLFCQPPHWRCNQKFNSISYLKKKISDEKGYINNETMKLSILEAFIKEYKNLLRKSI